MININQENKNIEGDFNFYISQLLIDKDSFTPYKILGFDLNIEMFQDVITLIENVDPIEYIAEKMKKDFIEAMKKNNFKEIEINVDYKLKEV